MKPIFDDASERNVIGSCMIAEDAARLVTRSLTVDDFYSAKNKVMFRAILNLQKQGAPIDLISIAGLLEQNEELFGVVGGCSGIASYEQDVLTTQNTKWYCQRLRRASGLRQVVSTLENYQHELSDLDITGVDPDEITDNLREIIGKLQDAEEVTTGDTADNPRNRLNILTLDQLFNLHLPDNEEIVADEVIIKGDLCILVGPAGLGKSRISLQLAIDSALSRPWLGKLPIKKCDTKYLILQTENGARRLCHDLSAALRGVTKNQREHLNQHLAILVPERLQDRELSLDNSKATQRLRNTIAQFQPHIIIWDPLIEFFQGTNENDAVQMRETIRKIMGLSKSWSEQTGVIIIHHARAGRQAAASAVGWEAAAYSRGSKALTAACRCQINMAPGSGEDDGTVVVVCGKNNNARKFKPFACRLDEDTMTYLHDPTFNLAEWDKEVTAARAGRSTKAKIENVVHILQAGKDVGMHYATLTDTLCEAHALAKRTAQRLISQTISVGLIKNVHGLYWLADGKTD